ncbi:PD-(D/E)XK nuclease family protein [Bifidobacterium sp. B4107]|uniref:PD-(D/E)XK nuclease family protein n=1 Tax=unclassified Bifidobacterium TaxID=2608897 RepID=UPI00226B4A6F|nr:MULTISPECIES: PD-(D/E)XK nuclease family protein [unclassified Bifidobacterium]MCX8647606.1 PD-(D/E)XK nuclease family protein [Bifidobacterium sp. B4107]MCX8651786.1 PD-(D/E)XK nuclease family protein [Bifidobacterium sp. B4111]MCX8658578.1 PD-(D/E)XK nuclease family protein [Bifidobacterium sp. B4114]
MSKQPPVEPQEAMEPVRALIGDRLQNEEGRPTRALVVAGPPRSGKTRLTTRALLAGMEQFGDGASMAVSGRTAADQVSRQVILERGRSDRTRPVGTLQALAFRLLTRSRLAQGGHDPLLPRLLNGAEEDALLRQVMTVHLEHVQAGDDCAVCRLLERYFRNGAGWSSVLVGDDQGRVVGVADRFIAQLRDMFARMTELGLDRDDRDQLLDALAVQPMDPDRRDRLGLQWRLAFALEDEYRQSITESYPDEFRLDPSMLMVEASRSLDGLADDDLPDLLVVDDWQDITLAGMGLLQGLNQAGCRLLLVGNPDQSVQSFRGSYPEFLATRLTALSKPMPSASAPLLAQDFACLDAATVTLKPRRMVVPEAVAEHTESGRGSDPAAPGSYADLVAARVSLGIAGVEENDTPLPDRPGKLPAWPGAGPVAPLTDGDGLIRDGSVQTRLFHTPDQEDDDLVWQIKHEFLANQRDWNDMAVIAHDNMTLRTLGRKLRVQGVPVRFSSVTRPLSQEPAIQGLFALVELAQSVLDPGAAGSDPDDPAQVAAWIRSRLRTLMAGPLFRVPATAARAERPVRMERLESIMETMAALAPLSDQRGSDPDSSGSLEDLPFLGQAWQTWVEDLAERRAQRDRSSGISVDDSLLTRHDCAEPGDGSGPFSTASAPDQPVDLGDRGAQQPAILSVQALETLLVLDPDDRSSGIILEAMTAIAGGRREDPDVQVLDRALQVLHLTATRISALDRQPQYVLWEAWRSLDLADDWQRRALMATQEGEEANDRLDALMRLFQYAAGSRRFPTVEAFMDQVRTMQIEADSLARIGPIEHAVTLTTPAGAAALATDWPLVWLPAVQDGVWPNLIPRDTMFGAEELADLVLHDRIGDPLADTLSHDPALRSILYAEKKGFLEALTRARTQVRISAVWNDDLVPSDFLYGYLPERYPRTADMSQAEFSMVGAGSGGSERYGGLEVSARGLTAAARSILAVQALLPEDQVDRERVDDAVQALRLLADQGQDSADPRHWPFLYDHDQEGAAEPASAEEVHTAQAAESRAVGAASGVTSVTERDHAPRSAHASVNQAGQADRIQNRDQGRDHRHEHRSDRQVVLLSPSAVDAIWNCPLEWALGDQFSGPSPSRVPTEFGSLIHKVASEGTAQGLDRPGQGDPDARQQQVRDALLDIYQELAPQEQRLRDPDELYDQRGRRSRVEPILDNLASYFVRSSDSQYGLDGKSPVPVGDLLGVQSERSFDVSLSVEDLVPVWKATFPDRPLDADGLFALMSGLVDGFPAALDSRTTVRLTGRIDRLEVRSLPEGIRLRLVDYKTGRVPYTQGQLFNDLQLVCYQLGLAFPPTPGSSPEVGAAWSLPQAPDLDRTEGMKLSQSLLLQLQAPPKDAQTGLRREEMAYQPPLFERDRLVTIAQPRTGMPSPLKSKAEPADLPDQVPPGVDADLWGMVRAARVSSQAVWGLTMIARVFFAAGVKLTAGRDDAVFDPVRCHRAGNGQECQAWQLVAPNLLEDQE